MENINVKVINQNNVDIKVTPQVSNVVEVVTPQPFSIKIDKGTVGPQGPEGPAGPAGEGVPTGGTTGQALVKTSDADYDTEWSDTVPNATNAVNADNATYATSAGSALTADEATHAISADSATNATHAATADSATLAGNVTGIVAVANGGTGADNANSARSNLSAAKSGANSDITSLSGITGGISTADFVQFDTTYATTLGVGQIGWDGNNTLGLGMAGGNVVQKIGEDFFYYVKASSAIAKGQLCMFTGSVGASGVVTAAPATGVTNGQYIMGVAAEAISNNAFGLVQVFGTLRNVDTSAFADGDVLYYNSAVTGGYTTTFPASGPIVTCAAVVKGGSSGGGVLQVRITNTQRLTAGSGITVTQNGAGTTITNANPSSGGTVTSVDAAGTVNGLTLTGGPITTSGTITLGGTLDLSSPPAIGGTTPAAGMFTTLNTTGLTTLKNSSGTYVAVMDDGGVSDRYAFVRDTGGGAYIRFNSGNGGLRSAGTGGIFIQTNNGSQTQFGVSHTASAVNYVQVTGAATGNPPVISAQGSDASVAMRMQAKGAGAIAFLGGGGGFLANITGSSGTGRNYLQLESSATTVSPVLSAQGGDTNIDLSLTTKGTGTINLNTGNGAVAKFQDRGGSVDSPWIFRAGLAGTTGTVLTSSNSARIQTGDASGFAFATNAGTTGAGGGSTQFNIAHTASAVNYVQVTGAATGAFPTISAQGSDATVSMYMTSKGTGALRFLSGNSSYTQLRIDGSVAAVNSLNILGSITGAAPTLGVQGNDTNIDLALTPKGTGSVRVAQGATGASGLVINQDVGTTANSARLFFDTSTANGVATIFNVGGTGLGVYTGGTIGSSSGFRQINIAPTLSAVNYVQVTGATTTNFPTISAQGSDANIGLRFSSKGTSGVSFNTGGGLAVNITDSGGTTANYLQIQGRQAGNGPIISAQGSDTDIDLALTPKGAGRVKFGTYTASILTPTGYIEIVDSGGTVRRLLVG